MIEGERGHLSEAALPEGVARDVLEAVVREGEHHQAVISNIIEFYTSNQLID